MNSFLSRPTSISLYKHSCKYPERIHENKLYSLVSEKLGGIVRRSRVVGRADSAVVGALGIIFSRVAGIVSRNEHRCVRVQLELNNNIVITSTSMKGMFAINHVNISFNLNYLIVINNLYYYYY